MQYQCFIDVAPLIDMQLLISYTCQKSAKNPMQKLPKNPAKIQQKPYKNPLKICDKNFFRTKIFYHLTKN
jgi:hypothetical protein